MTRTLSMLALAAVAAVGMSASAHACPGANLQIKNLTLNSDGTVTRSVYVRKFVGGKNGKPESMKIVPMVRDQLKLEQGDELNLNAAPSMVDATLQAQIYLKSQDRDEKGILSSTYHVIEIATGAFGGNKEKAIRTAYLATVKSTYLGNGTYSRGCGEVIKTELDQESSTDVHH